MMSWNVEDIFLGVFGVEWKALQFGILMEDGMAHGTGRKALYVQAR